MITLKDLNDIAENRIKNEAQKRLEYMITA